MESAEYGRKAIENLKRETMALREKDPMSNGTPSATKVPNSYQHALLRLELNF